MTLLWLLVGASLVVALAAWSRARRTARRLAQITEMYWELKYQQGELRVRMQRLTGEAPAPPPQAPASAPAPGPPGEAFVPLASLTPHRASVRGGDPTKR